MAGRIVRYLLRRSQRARRASLRVDHDHGLVIVLPRRWPLAELAPLLREHAAWIDAQVDRYGVRDGPRRRELVDGCEVSLLGRPRRLVIRPRATPGRSRVRLHEDPGGGCLEVNLAAADLLGPRPVLERWLRRQARRWLTARVAALAALVGAAPRRIVVGERRSRWGSCSPGGTLSFCYRLIMAPPEVIDAIVLHELCHLVHLDHGPRFYGLYDRVCPDHRAHRAWLRAHEGELKL